METTKNNITKEIQEQHEIVQKQIDEICEMQTDDYLRQKELSSVMQGYGRFLKNQGLNAESIVYYLNKLDLSKEVKGVI